MKRIYILLSLLVAYCSVFGQTPQNLGGPNTIVITRGLLAMDTGFVYRTNYTDTTAANTSNYLENLAGVVIRTGNRLWMRSNDLTQWLEIGSGALNIESSASITLDGDGSVSDPLTANLAISETEGNLLQVLADGAYVPSFVQNGLIEGGEFIWVSGYTYDVVATTYAIGGIVYEADGTQVTLANADPTLDRIDRIVATTSETIIVIEGTPADDPQEPSYDPTTQLPLGFIYVTANTVEPPTPPTQEWIYINNTEWTTLSSTARINPASTTNPYSATLDIEATLAQNGDNIRFTDPSPPTTMSDYNVLTFKLFSKAAWSPTSRLSLQWYSGATPVGNAVSLSTGTYGFNSAQVTTYQTTAIELSKFGPLTTTTALLITVVTTNGATIGFYLDDIQLQNATIPSGGNFWAQGGNSYGTTGVFGTNDNYPINFITNNSTRMKLLANGRLLLNTNTDAGYQLQVTGTSYSDVGFFPQILTAASSGASNFAVRAGSTVGYNTDAELLVEGGTSLGARVIMRGSTSPGLAGSGISPIYANIIMGEQGISYNSPNTSPLFAGMILRPIIATKIASGAVANLATLYIENAATLAGGLVPTGGNYALWVKAGTNVLGGETLIGSATDNGDFKLQVAGGVRVDATGKEITLVGLDTDNTATQVAGKDGSGNLVWRDVSSISGGGTYTADNGLTMASNNVQLGGALTGSTTITTGAFFINVTGSRTGSILQADNSSATVSGYGLYGSGVGVAGSGGGGVYGTSNTAFGVHGNTTSGQAVRGISDSGVGGYFESLSGLGVSTFSLATAGKFKVGNSSTATILPVVNIDRVTTGTAASGMGASILFTLESTTTEARTAGRLIYKWSTPTDATRTSQFVISGVNNAVEADVFTLSGNGSLTLGAAYQGLGAGYLAVSNTGEVTWSAGGGGGGGDALTSNPLSQFAATTSLQLLGVISDETGSGSLVFATSPTLVTPVLGTPTSVTLTNATDLPVSTGISGLGTNVATALAVNVGSAGAFVTFDGAAGTPSSLTLTNATGLPVDAGTTGTLPIARGGTALTALGTAGQVLRVNAGATGLEYVTLSGTGTVTSITLTQPAAGFTVTNSGVAATTVGTFTFALANDLLAVENLGTTGLVRRTGTSTWSAGTDVSLTDEVSGILDIANGGTGLSSATSARVLIGNGTTWTAATPTGSNGITITMGAGTMNMANVFNPTPQTLVDGATITWNVTNGGNAKVTLAAAGRTLSITNPVAGYTYTIEITQGSGGGKTITTWPTGTRWQGGTAPTLSSAAADVDVITLYYNGSNYLGTYGLDYN